MSLPSWLKKSSFVTLMPPNAQYERISPFAMASSILATIISASAVSCFWMCLVYSGSSSWVLRNQNNPSSSRQIRHKNHIICPRMPMERRFFPSCRINCAPPFYRAASGSNL